MGMMARSPIGARVELKGPVGERNVYTLRRRGRIAAVAASENGLLIQIGAILATGNDAVVSAALAERVLLGLPAEFRHRISRVEDPLGARGLAFALLEGDEAATIGDLAQAREPRRADRAAAGAIQRASRRRRGLQPRRPRRGMRDRYEHGRRRRQCEPDDDRLGCTEQNWRRRNVE